MLLEDRKEYTLKLLQKKSSVTVSELSKIFQVSEVSVRKMLMKMEEDGQVKRTWGGAVSVDSSLREMCIRDRWRAEGKRIRSSLPGRTEFPASV